MSAFANTSSSFTSYKIQIPIIMKFAFALAAISAAVASASSPFAPAQSKQSASGSYVSSLMRGAKATKNSELGRRLDQNGQWEEYEIDISGYSIQFEKCQFIKSYDDDLAENGDSETVLATKRFVVFRLCPTSSSNCNSGFGEYIVDLETYLQSTVNYQQEMQQEMCNACQECYNNQDQQQEDGQEDQQQDDQQQDQANRKLQQYSADCDTCYDECMKIENMEENGYVDATNFLDCQMIYDAQDDDKQALYAGPMCASEGSKIKIGVFTDEECNFLDNSKDVDDYLQNDNGYNMKLSHALLKTVYSDETTVSCAAPQDEDQNQNQDGNGQQQEVEILEVCGDLYDAAAKCEKTHGFDNGYSNYYGYENQLAQEGVVCDFIDSVKAGSYDDVGEIVVNGYNNASGGGSKTTGGQKFALTFFILGTVGLSVYAAMLHSKLTKGSAAGLTSNGGAMA